MIGQTISHYRVISQLGEGGMGVVYVAEDTLLGRRVAVKIPVHAPGTHNYHARFLREARSVSALSHPHIATVFDFGETPDGRPFIVMELVNGQDLGALMRAGALTIARACEIVEHVAAALGEAHRHGIIHRDVKPSNILVNERGEVKVLDFGLAKLIEEHPGLAADPDARTLQALKTRSDVIVGTPLYLSPEQATGMPVDARSDLFGLGALLYEAVAGRPAFNGANLIEIAAQVLHVEPPPPSQFNQHVPPELDRITMKALAKKPEERYQHADDLIRDLHAFRTAYALSDSANIERVSRRTYAQQNRSALVTLSEGLRRPRLSIATVLGGVVLVAALLVGLNQLLRKRPHQPSPEAKRAYDTGTDFLRDNAYYRASKALAEAVRTDDEYALAHARLAEALTELDDTDHAKDETLKVTTLVPDPSILPPLDALYLDAIKATTVRDFARAAQDYQEIARRTPDQPQVYVDLGRAYEKAGEIPKAIESYLTATNLAPKYATAFLRVGILYGRQQQFPSANTCFDRADEIYNNLANTEGHTEVLYQRGLLYRNNGRIPEAHNYLEQALKLAESTGNQAQRVNAMLQLSTVIFAENETGRAEQMARDAVEIAQTNGMETLTAMGLVDLADVYLTRGDYAEAEKYFNQAIEFAQRYKVPRAAAKARVNLGNLRLKQNKVDEAIEYLNQALTFYQANNYRAETARCFVNLGRARLLKGAYDEALKTFQQQEQFAGQLGDKGQLATAHEYTGTTLEILERYTEALPNYEQKYELSKALGNQKGVGWGLAERGGVLWQLGRYDDARPLLDEAVQIAERPNGGYKDVSAAVYVSNAELALSQRQFPAAQEQARRALAVASAAQLTDQIVRAKRVLGLAQTMSGAAREGRHTCADALDAATRANTPYLIAAASLALAQAMFEDNDTAGALKTALSAEATFAQNGQLASDWLAWLVAARASQRAGDVTKAREYAAKARAALENIQQKWGGEAYNGYINRLDVQYSRRQLSQI